MQRVPLAPHHVAAMRALGAEAHYEPGAFLVQPGERVDRFIYVEDGEVELVNPFTNQRHLPSTLGPTQFLGEIAFLSGARPDRERKPARTRHPDPLRPTWLAPAFARSSTTAKLATAFPVCGERVGEVSVTEI